MSKNKNPVPNVKGPEQETPEKMKITGDSVDTVILDEIAADVQGPTSEGVKLYQADVNNDNDREPDLRDKDSNERIDSNKGPIDENGKTPSDKPDTNLTELSTDFPRNTTKDEPVADQVIKAKTLGNSDASGVSVNVPDVVFFGDGDQWKLLCKASSEAEGWMKSTKAMEIGHDVLVQVTTQQMNPDGSYVVAEALCLVPFSKIIIDLEEGGRKLEARVRRF